ncbi:hypothetical protein WJX72_010592 [[Myrmecia] bisecta]|uniref:Uncharacterized protein n=1 Tax=[Myrmecia] bisecta TaxID=41462 RepID=A0AAW1R9D2_9CHLO
MTEIAAARVAELEDQTERQRRALSELAVAAEELANDNVALSAEVLQLRDEKKGSREAMAALEDRVVNLQELYLRGLEAASLAPPASAREALQQRALDELATPEILAASRPPRDFPLPEGPPSTAIVPALHEIEALRRERDMLIAQVKALGERTAQLDTENGDLVQQCAAQKRAVHEASTLGQNRLVGAMRRIQYLVAKVAERDDTIKEKSKYIVRLETRLLAQHKTMQTAAVRNKPGTRAGSRSQQANWPAKSPFHPDNRGKAATADAAQENEQTEPGREQALQATTPGTVREVEAAARDEFAQHAQHTPQPPHLARHEVRPEGDGEQGRDAHLNIDQLEQRIDALNRTLTAKQASVSRLPAQTLGSTISEASFDDGDAGLLEWAQSVPTDDADGAAPHQGPGYSRSTPQPRAELQARLSPVAASWNLYKSSHSSSAAATPPRNEAWQRDEQLAAAQRPAGSPHQSQASVSGSPVEDVAAAPPTQPQRLSERIKANHKVSMDEIEGFTQRLLTLHGKAGYQLAPRQNPHLRP